MRFARTLLLTTFTACATPKTVAMQQAAFDHRCPENNIRVLRESDDRRSLELDVCGSVRRYQDVSKEGLTWVDVTGNSRPPDR